MNQHKPIFCYVSEEYLDFLRYGYKQEKKIMLHSLDKYNIKKFVFGVILDLELTNGIKYFSPVSSIKNKETKILVNSELNDFYSKFLYPIKTKSKKYVNGEIKNVKQINSFIRFDYMFPVPEEELFSVDFNTRPDKDFILQEYKYCTSKRAIEEMRELSRIVYNKTTLKQDKYNIHCCNFTELEKKYHKWIKGHVSDYDKKIYKKMREEEITTFK